MKRIFYLFAVSASNGTNVECQVVIDENVVSGVDGVDHDVKKSKRGVVMKEEEDLESDGGGGGFDLLGGGGGEVDDDLEDVTPDIKQIKQEETKPQVTSPTTKSRRHKHHDDFLRSIINATFDTGFCGCQPCAVETEKLWDNRYAHHRDNRQREAADGQEGADIIL